MSNLLANPHSASSSSQFTTRRVEAVRARVLNFVNASPDQFDVIFVANATAGIKLVMDSFREHATGFWYGYHKDAHTSLVGVREAAGAGHRCFESDDEVVDWLHGKDEVGEDLMPTRLFAYPAQSNMNGRRLPLDWPARIRRSGGEHRHKMYTLLDAASYVSTSQLDLSDASLAPDFTTLSFYKIFGFPDLGALIVRRDSGHALEHRRYFGGGTVEVVTCVNEQWSIRKEGSLHQRLEDGTLPIHSIIALDNAFDVHEKLFRTHEDVSSHTLYVAKRLHDGLMSLKHKNGMPICQIYNDFQCSYGNTRSQGPIIAFNLKDSHGSWISNAEFEKLATLKNIHVRSGTLCNPGGVASALALAPWELKHNFSAGQRCDNENDIISNKPTGVIRVSFGAMSTIGDVKEFLKFLHEFFVNKLDDVEPQSRCSSVTTGFYVETLMIYPIKSCGGWPVPYQSCWDVNPEGLAWDREWCLINQSTRSALNQKRYPAMALLKPCIDLEQGILRIRYNGSLPPNVPSEIEIPLSEEPNLYHDNIIRGSTNKSHVCGDSVSARTYASSRVSSFFSQTLGIPCYLARFPTQGSGSSARHAKAHLQPHQETLRNKQITSGMYQTPKANDVPDSRLPRPILLSNESPILVISRSSLNRLNEAIKCASGKAASAEVFRANIIIAEDPSFPPGIEQPYVEDTWQHLKIISAEHTSRSANISPNQPSKPSERSTDLEILGSCRRCQMVCIDQTTAERNEEPFVTLAKTRRFNGKVYFGQHVGLLGSMGQGTGQGKVKIGDKVVGYGSDLVYNL